MLDSVSGVTTHTGRDEALREAREEAWFSSERLLWARSLPMWTAVSGFLSVF